MYTNARHVAGQTACAAEAGGAPARTEPREDGRAAPSPHAVFGEFEKSLQRNQMVFIEQNIGSYELLERLTGFQRYVHGEVSKKHQETSSHRTDRPTDEALTEIFLLGVLNQNIDYAFSAWRALEHGLHHVCGSLMRNVVESVPKSFYLIANPHDIKKFRLSEMYLTYKSQKPRKENNDLVREFLQSRNAQETLDGEQIVPKEFNKFRREHRHEDICEKIYDGTCQRQRELYSMLSSSSHASMDRFATPSRNPVLDGRFANMLTDLSFFSLFLTANSQHRLLRYAGLVRDVERFVNAAWRDLGHPDPLTDMYPDEPEYLDCLPLKLPP